MLHSCPICRTIQRSGRPEVNTLCIYPCHDEWRRELRLKCTDQKLVHLSLHSFIVFFSVLIGDSRILAKSRMKTNYYLHWNFFFWHSVMQWFPHFFDRDPKFNIQALGRDPGFGNPCCRASERSMCCLSVCQLVQD